jgi:hypothetical protein
MCSLKAVASAPSTNPLSYLYSEYSKLLVVGTDTYCGSICLDWASSLLTSCLVFGFIVLIAMVSCGFLSETR